ncbi:GNAT family N-acetyltransferase [Streptomyces sp. SID8352]|uniref:GNAT family N-acetyltransferase n=1 Tax=Streptomyces sp. SID8352 TaxID=2690338 RepID=UPI0013691AC5|nr:GNAT family N-acetyltransferase [Streptomyces sp. SID8352]MYU20977.1 GNAT family N-acetyltransferase [Streptomyces sp. SID8352]
MTAESLERPLGIPSDRREWRDGRTPSADRARLVLRTAREEDLPELLRLDREVFQDVAYPGFLLRQMWDMYAEHFLVLDAGEGRLRGYVLAATTTPALGLDSWILGLCVARDRRRRGLGRELMTEIIARLRRDGVARVRLTVEPANRAAIRLYRSLGFRPEGPDAGLRPDYFGPGMHRLVLGLPLTPAEG